MTVLKLEEWRPIIDWPYEVSNYGRVRRSEGGSSNATYKGKILKPFAKGLDKKSRYYVRLCKNGIEKDASISRLVCIAFHGLKPSDKDEVAHNDGNGLNNVWTNLRWATRSENQKDKIIHGTHSRGEKAASSKLKEEDVRNIRYLFEHGFYYKDIAKLWNISFATIYNINSGATWAHLQTT